MTLARRCGVHSAARQAACEAVLRRVQDAGLDSVRIAWADLHGTLRGKALVTAGPALQAALQDGIGMVSTLLHKDTSDRTAWPPVVPGDAGGAPRQPASHNVLLLPDPASFAVLPWAPGTGWLRADACAADGSPLALDPRRALQRALAGLRAAGHGLRVGLEIEFHIYRISAEALAPEAATWPAEPPALQLVHPGYQLLSESCADLADAPLAIVRRTALALGLPLLSLEIEFGPSQVEAVFAPTDALTAADQMVLFRSAVRQALRRAGYHASFVCRPPFAGAIASGWHLHQSLLNAQGHSAMRQPGGVGSSAGSGLSDAGRHWLAGLLAHAGGMAALCAPTIPAYSRFRGSLMAPQAAVWGRDNRGAMLRVIGDSVGDSVGDPVGDVTGRGPGDASHDAVGDATVDPAPRIENRIAEPSANPYLAWASQIWAGLDGVQRQLDPGPACEAPYADGLPLLPVSLNQALDALAADTVLCQGLGAPLAQAFDAVKRQELARHAAAEDQPQWERREYFSRY